MKHWSEVRTAFFVAQTGSVSGAARALNVHRATILRHLDVIERELGSKIFFRDAKGYQLTEVGEDLLRVAKLTEEQFTDFVQRAKGQQGELQGEFILTSIESLSDLLMPAVHMFSRRHPKIRVRWLTGSELMKLEYGQAHVALRSGPEPQDDNYVVLPFIPLSYGLYANVEYLNEFGTPQDEKSLQSHRFVFVDSAPQRLGIIKWFNEVVPPEQIVCTSNNREILERAVFDGLGIGFMQCQAAANDEKLKRVLPNLHWDFQNWIVTHGDIHRSKKVQAFLTILKSAEYQEEVAALKPKSHSYSSDFTSSF